jgi:hypothetical protein
MFSSQNNTFKTYISCNKISLSKKKHPSASFPTWLRCKANQLWCSIINYANLSFVAEIAAFSFFRQKRRRRPFTRYAHNLLLISITSLHSKINKNNKINKKDVHFLLRVFRNMWITIWVNKTDLMDRIKYAYLQHHLQLVLIFPSTPFFAQSFHSK